MWKEGEDRQRLCEGTGGAGQRRGNTVTEGKIRGSKNWSIHVLLRRRRRRVALKPERCHVEEENVSAKGNINRVKQQVCRL